MSIIALINSYYVAQHENITISIYPCYSVLAARFSNITKFEYSHRRAAITYTHDIFHNECKRPHHAAWKISNLYIENKCHHLTPENKFRLLLTKGVHNFLCSIHLLTWQGFANFTTISPFRYQSPFILYYFHKFSACITPNEILPYGAFCSATSERPW